MKLEACGLYSQEQGGIQQEDSPAEDGRLASTLLSASLWQRRLWEVYSCFLTWNVPSPPWLIRKIYTVRGWGWARGSVVPQGRAPSVQRDRSQRTWKEMTGWDVPGLGLGTGSPSVSPPPCSVTYHTRLWAGSRQTPQDNNEPCRAMS